MEVSPLAIRDPLDQQRLRCLSVLQRQDVARLDRRHRRTDPGFGGLASDPDVAEKKRRPALRLAEIEDGRQIHRCHAPALAGQPPRGRRRDMIVACRVEDFQDKLRRELRLLRPHPTDKRTVRLVDQIAAHNRHVVWPGATAEQRPFTRISRVDPERL